MIEVGAGGRVWRWEKDREREREIVGDVTTLLDLQVENGAMSQGTQEASRSWKKRENRFPPEPLEGTQLC